MKIAHLISTFPPYKGGMGNVCLAQAKELVKLGHELVVFTPGKEKKIEQRDGFKVKYVRPWFKYGNAFFVPGLIKELKDFEIIHLHWPFLGGAEVFLVWCLLGKLKSKLVVQYHMDLIAPGIRGLIFKLNSFLFLPLMVKRADNILVSSWDYLKHAHIYGLWQKNQDKFKVSCFGVDQAWFYPQNKDESLLKKYNLSLNDKIILSVGGLDKAHYFKGVKLLIRALSQLKEKDSCLKLLIVGEGDLKAGYEKLARELGLGQRVVFAGRVSDFDLPKYYNLADIFAFPSFTRSEAFGLATLEAMACAKPILVSNLPGPRSLVQGNGLIVKINSVDDLANKIKIAFSDKEQLKKWGNKSLQLVQEKYHWPSIIKDLY